MAKMAVKEMLLGKLRFDLSFYPRSVVDSTRAGMYRRAKQAGAEFPPYTACAKTFRVVDGFHRGIADTKLYGLNSKVTVHLKRYANDREMFEDMFILNRANAYGFDQSDRIHSALIAKDEFGMTDEEITNLLQITDEDYCKLVVCKTARSNGGMVGIKATIRNMAGESLSKKQLEVNKKLTGLRQTTYANQLIMLIESKMLDVQSASLMERLRVLRVLLEKIL